MFTHRGARTHDHKVKSLALDRLSEAGMHGLVEEGHAQENASLLVEQHYSLPPFAARGEESEPFCAHG